MANEVDEDVISFFSTSSLIGITPQGWMRTPLPDKRVGYQPWQPSEMMIKRADAVIISDEDVQKDESVILNYAQLFRLLVVTEGFNGARVYWHGDVRHFSAPKMNVLDPTGAGDIFAAVFLIRLKASGDPWQAAETAVRLASLSVTRKGLDSAPRIEEVKSSLMEIIKGSSSQ
jgi:sugar/nucleoside kinase (ribokinase family)